MEVKRKFEQSTAMEPPLKIAKLVDVEEKESLSIDKALESPIVEAPQDKSKQTPTTIDPLSRIIISSSPAPLEQIQKALEMTMLKGTSLQGLHLLLHPLILKR